MVPKLQLPIHRNAKLPAFVSLTSLSHAVEVLFIHPSIPHPNPPSRQYSAWGAKEGSLGEYNPSIHDLRLAGDVIRITAGKEGDKFGDVFGHTSAAEGDLRDILD